jgi:hypothetical protein
LESLRSVVIRRVAESPLTVVLASKVGVNEFTGVVLVLDDPHPEILNVTAAIIQKPFHFLIVASPI